MLAEKAQKIPQIEEDFTLVSGSVAINKHDPQQFRREYYSNLR